MEDDQDRAETQRESTEVVAPYARLRVIVVVGAILLSLGVMLFQSLFD